MNKKLLLPGQLATLLLLLGLLASCSLGQSRPSDVVQNAGQAIMEGYDARDLTKFDSYFATPAQGADLEGLANTQRAVHDLLDRTDEYDLLDLLSFNATDQMIDEAGGEATVHYRAEVSLDAGDLPVRAVVVEQEIALIKVEDRWLISGGDLARIMPLRVDEEDPQVSQAHPLED
jgi:hypothetical protein